MSPAEIAHRVANVVQNGWEARFRLDPAVPAPDLAVHGTSLLTEVDISLEERPYREAADRLLSGQMRVFAKDDAPFPPQWNRDPKTGTQAPLSFGKGINYRHEAVVGDIKYLWEPNRHQELVTLAQAWRLTDDARYLDAIAGLLRSWLDECPYPYGVNWTSSLELGLRLVNWSFVWDLTGGLEASLFDGEGGRALRDDWLKSIFLHQDFIARHLSFHSSANNHILGEYLGLYVAGSRWPFWAKSQQWRTLGREGFLGEALLQTGRDGVNKEQAVYYQHEVMDMMILAGLLARAEGQDFPADYWARLEAMCEFLAAVMDVGGNVPMIGDADDARIARLDPGQHSDPYKPLLAAGAILFDREDFAHKAERLDDKTCWLLPNRPLPWPSARAPVTTFGEGGYYVLGHNLEQADEIRLVCDCAPLGYLSIAAHGHADALAFTLSEGGMEWFVDPGTFAYHTEKKWRDHFRSTLAHNTLCIDGFDQSVIGGNFMWMHKANASLVQFDAEAGLFEGEHDGYRRLADPVTHRRRIELDGPARVLTVTDFLECSEEHEVALSFQLAEGCTARIDNGEVLVGKVGRTIRIRCEDTRLEPVILEGETDPPAGWISRRFDEKSAAPMIRWTGRVSRAQIRTVITMQEGARS